MKIVGMKCHSCAKIIKLTLEDKQGIGFTEVDFDSGKVSLEFQPNQINISEIKKAIEELGYRL